MKTQELEKQLLNDWVAMSLGWRKKMPSCLVWVDEAGNYQATVGGFRPSEDWSYGGPLIDSHDIRFRYPQSSFFCDKPDHIEAICGTGMGKDYPMPGNNRLQAAMRALVASVYGVSQPYHIMVMT